MVVEGGVDVVVVDVKVWAVVGIVLVFVARRTVEAPSAASECGFLFPRAAAPMTPMSTTAATAQNHHRVAIDFVEERREVPVGGDEEFGMSDIEFLLSICRN